MIKIFKEENFKLFFRDNKLLTLRLDLINKCNFRCVMCHYSNKSIRSRPKVLVSLDDFIQFFDPISKRVKEVVLSCGDEPLMSPNFKKILHFLSEYPDLDISLCTNASLLDSENRAAIISAGVTYVMFSLDGTQKKTVERIRKGADYDRVVSNIKAMFELKAQTKSSFPEIALDYVLMSSNLSETIAFVELAKLLDASLIDFRHAFPSKFWSDEKEMLSFHKSRFNFFRKKILKKAKELQVRVTIPDKFLNFVPHIEKTLDTKVLLKDFHLVNPDKCGFVPKPKRFSDTFVSRKPLTLPFKYLCERPFSEIHVKDKKFVYPCAWHKEPLGVIEKDNDLESIFLNKKFSSLRSDMVDGKLNMNCRGCPIIDKYLPTKTKKIRKD